MLFVFRYVPTLYLNHFPDKKMLNHFLDKKKGMESALSPSPYSGFQIICSCFGILPFWWHSRWKEAEPPDLPLHFQPHRRLCHGLH